VTRYLEFKQISGSYVYRDGRIAKVPATEMEAVRSSLMGIFEKRRMKRFLEFIGAYQDNDSATHQGLNLDRNTMAEVYYKFGLEKGTQDFIGHAMALHLDDAYLGQPARETYKRILLYLNSVARYGKSPYLYPLYGLGELPQGFARLSAIYGGTYMLDKPIDEIVYEGGKAVGVKSGGETARAKKIIGDPSYFPDKVKKVGRVIRTTCLLTHPIPNTDNVDSVQIIIPQNQIGRKHDIYVALVSSTHNVCSKGHYLAVVSTMVETDNPQEEIRPGLNLLGPIMDQFTNISDLYEPTTKGEENVHVSRSYDATSHFETTTDDVNRIYMEMENKPLVLKQRPTQAEEENFNVAA
jgi:Rab GDP dissociation inhibitor